MNKDRFYFLYGAMQAIDDDLPDGAYWAQLEEICGGYEAMLSFLEAGSKYRPEEFSKIGA